MMLNSQRKGVFNLKFKITVFTYVDKLQNGKPHLIN